MADPKLPYGDNINHNLRELFERLSFTADDSGKPRNFDGYIETLQIVGNTPFTIYHKLDRTPIGYFLLRADEYVLLKEITKTERLITLESAAGGNITVMIF